MDDPFPAGLPPVRYFLMEINSDGWFDFFRILAVVILVISALLYFHYRKKLVKSSKLPDKGKLVNEGKR